MTFLRYSFILLSLFWGSSLVYAQNRHYDYLIKQAVIFDGKSPEGFLGDVAILGDKIETVGNLEGASAFESIDAKGLVLAPGFIDSHTHSDFNPMVYPDLANKLLQGVTTEIIGHCGMSAAPVLGPHYQEMESVWAREGVLIPEKVPWRTFQEYRRTMESQGLLTNFVGLVGHGNLRSAVMGFSARDASQSEIEEMRKLLAGAMKEGAFGISFGLVYIPGVFASQDEIVRLCREAARYSGVCAFHIRSEGNSLQEAISEIVKVAEKSQATVIISHLKASGKKNWGKIDEVFRLVEDARLRGLRIIADAYPYTAGAAELGVILPPGLYRKQDRNDYFRRLRNRREILKELRVYDEHGYFKWDSVVIASAREEEYWPFEGLSFKNIARKTGKEPEKFLIEILADNNFEVNAFYFTQSEEVVDRVIGKSYVAIGSDSVADGSRRPHPRAYGTFPKIFRRYVRGKKSLAVGEAIRKMTSLMVDHFGLEGRGYIRPGYYADLVLFDAGHMKDKATYKKPTREGQGMEWVFINGVPVVRKGRVTGEKKGHFLLRTW